MSNSIPLSDLESSPAAKFNNIGDAYAGKIISMVERPQTDPVTNKPKTFDDGTPRMQWVISIQQANGEVVALYAKGGKYKAVTGEGESMLSAIGAAVRAANAQGVDVGAELAVAHTGLGESVGALNAPKLFKAQYRPAAAPQVPVDLFSA